ncbi:20052_t:CDS:2 [Entrophospora sp. SA101]|nr:20052_t:CDS:2 [Entrophospora sp. SA101]
MSNSSDTNTPSTMKTQLSKVDAFNLVVVIAPNLSQDHLQHSHATRNLSPNSRRDENSHHDFCFRNPRELYAVRCNIWNRNLASAHSFLRDRHPNSQLEPVGKAWIISKIEARESDIGKMSDFFIFLESRHQNFKIYRTSNSSYN